MASQTLATYRQLLREVRRQFPNKHEAFSKHLTSIYQQNKNVTDPDKQQILNRNAENVLVYLRSSRQHKELRERYSAIVMEQKKKVELTARRVGLELPKEYRPDTETAATQRVMDAFHKSS